MRLVIVKMVSNLTAFFPFLQFVSFSFAAKQQVLNDDTGPFDSKFGKLANETLELFHVPGVSIAVVDGDNVWAEVGWTSPASGFIVDIYLSNESKRFGVT